MSKQYKEKTAKYHTSGERKTSFAQPFIQSLIICLLVSAAVAGSGRQGETPPDSGQTRPASVTMPKMLESPVLDGSCGDPSYAHAGGLTLMDAAGGPAARALLIHSGRDAYLCFNGLPAEKGRRIAVRVDSDHSRGSLLAAGDYEFGVDVDGRLSARRGGAKGTFVPLSVPAADFDALVIKSYERTWSAELRISLEWLAGYARTDGFSLSLNQADGRPLQQWPRHARETAPDTWGDLVLGPVYPDSVHAGSAFFDGRGGYMVVPFAPELNPREITIEAWARVSDGGCGALVGNGQAVSYWMALCEELRFTHGGGASVFRGVRRLGDGWHHVAVTMDGGGLRTFYVDGEVDRTPGWSPPREKREGEREETARLGTSDRMLRLGSDRDAPDEQKNLHGYMRELRIWNRARSAQEIRDTAFRKLSGKEPGLVALWPFTNGLQDIIGRRDAGLIGNASLARETSDVAAFPHGPAPSPRAFPKPTPVPAWDAVIPLSEQQIKLDGMCAAAEYAQAAKLRLEPRRSITMNLLRTRDAIILCTNPLWGRRGSREGVTLWISRGGRGGALPGPSDLRVRLSPDGVVTATTGDGRDFYGPAPKGVESKTVSDTKFRMQEDIRTVNAHWFSSEVRIPLEAPPPYGPEEQLRFAVEYQAMLPANALPGRSRETQLGARWPSNFEPKRPETWGAAIIRRTPAAAERAGGGGFTELASNFGGIAGGRAWGVAGAPIGQVSDLPLVTGLLSTRALPAPAPLTPPTASGCRRPPS